MEVRIEVDEREERFPESILEMLRSKRLEEYAERLATNLSVLENILDKCGKHVETLIRSYPETTEWHPPTAIAIDSTYPPEGGVDLVAGVLSGYVVGAVRYVPRGMGWRKKLIRANVVLFDDLDGIHRELNILSKTEERRLALELLDEMEPGSLLLIDGEIVPYILYFAQPGDEKLEKLDELTYDVLSKAVEKGVVIAGVVKRSYTYLFNVIFSKCMPFDQPASKRIVKLNDKTVASLLLSDKPGHYILLGSYRDLLPAYARLLPLIKGSRASLSEIVETRLSTRRLYGEIRVVFYKPRRVNASVPAVKLEVFMPETSGVKLEDLLAHLNEITNRGTGLPAPIDLVDGLVRVEAGMLEAVRLKLMSSLRRRVAGRRAAIMLQFTNLEKYYLYVR